MKRIFFFCLVFVLFFSAFSPALVRATTFKTLLVSIEKYELAPLDYARNDIGHLATLLMSRYDGLAQACIDTAASLETTASSGETPKQSIEKRIADWCEQLLSCDTAILYLAGHGVKDENGRLYLAMTDFNRKNFDSAAIPLDWIREKFEKCDAQNKLLLIDTCFAGTSKSIDFEQASIGEVSDAFSKMKSVVTVASCQGDEKSWLWGEAKHSLFTYWLIEGLKGHADRDKNQEISFPELVCYLQENVSWVARNVLDKEQNPIALNPEAGKGFALKRRAISFQGMIEDVAQQIDLQMRLKKFTCIGIPEFTTGYTDKFEAEYGAMTRWVPEALRCELVRQARNNRSGYKVLTETAVQELLKANGITPNDLGTEKTKNMKLDDKGEEIEIPLLVRGRITLLSSNALSLDTELISTKEKENVANACGSALLNCKEMALCGLSGKFAITGNAPAENDRNRSEQASKPDPKPDPNPNDNPQSESTSETFTPDPSYGLVSQRQQNEAAQIIRERERLHPMVDPYCPYKVSFAIRPTDSTGPYAFRSCTIEGNQCFFAVDRGEEYSIRVHNKSEKPVFARILVDGLNTLAQAMPMVAKGAFVEEVTGGAAPSGSTFQLSPRVDLDGARSWVFRPGIDYEITGYTDDSIKTQKRFQVVDADESIAARSHYTEKIGTITIAFFEGVLPSSRSVGTTGGATEPVHVKGYPGPLVPGDMLVVMNVRYMTSESFKSLKLNKPVKSRAFNQNEQRPQPTKPVRRR